MPVIQVHTAASIQALAVDRLANDTTLIMAAVNATEESETAYQMTTFEIVVLIIVLALTTAFIAVLCYACRHRCDGRKNACESCRARQKMSPSELEDDLEDFPIVFDQKDVAGKQD